MSTTPRTDAAEFTLPVADTPGGVFYQAKVVKSDFARELEADNAKLREELSRREEKEDAADARRKF